MCIHPCIYQIAHTKTYVKYIYSVQCMCLIELCAGVSVCYCDKCKDLASLLTSIPHCMSICSSVSTVTITYTGEGIHSVCDNVLAFTWQCSTPHSFSVAVEYTLYTNTVVSHKCVLFIMYMETDTSIQQVLQGVMVVNAYQVPLYNTCHPCRGFALLVS